jgi:hypothetical protein
LDCTTGITGSTTTKNIINRSVNSGTSLEISTTLATARKNEEKVVPYHRDKTKLLFAVSTCYCGVGGCINVLAIATGSHGRFESQK